MRKITLLSREQGGDLIPPVAAGFLDIAFPGFPHRPWASRFLVVCTTSFLGLLLLMGRPAMWRSHFVLRVDPLRLLVFARRQT